VKTASFITDRDTEVFFLSWAGKFTRSQCLLVYGECGDVVTWIRSERNFSQRTESTKNYGQGLSALTLRLCTLFRNVCVMKCDKYVGMEFLEPHMLDLSTPRPDILRTKSSAFTVTLRAKDVAKLTNPNCCLYLKYYGEHDYTDYCCMLYKAGPFTSRIIVMHIHAFQYGFLRLWLPYFPVDNAHPKLFRHSFWCIYNAHLLYNAHPIPRMFIFYEFWPFDV
jgi:hypothetical protein